MALNQREKRMLLVPVALGAILAFYTWVHQPLFTRRAEAGDKQDKVAAELKRSESKLVKEGNLRVRKEAVGARERVIDAWVPGKNSAALFIWYLSQAEIKSGAHIKGITVSDKKQVTALSQPQPAGTAQPAPAPAKAAGTPAPGSKPAAPAAQPAPEAAPAPAAPILTVVTLDLKVDARWAQHLQFNQALEEMPLFQNTNALSMGRAGETGSLGAVGDLVQSGNTWLARQLLAASPELNGTYKVDLYFKSDKQGPLTDTMYFAESTGRMDPFALDGVDEFLKTIMQFYASQPGPGGTRGPLPPVPDDLKAQLG